jgi:hypothetical protein
VAFSQPCAHAWKPIHEEARSAAGVDSYTHLKELGEVSHVVTFGGILEARINIAQLGQWSITFVPLAMPEEASFSFRTGPRRIANSSPPMRAEAGQWGRGRCSH